TEEALMEGVLDAGAGDIRTSDEGFEVICPVTAFDKIAAALESAGIKAESSEIIDLPTVTMPVNDADTARSFFKLHDALEELDDVQNVFSNEEIAENVAEQARA